MKLLKILILFSVLLSFSAKALLEVSIIKSKEELFPVVIAPFEVIGDAHQGAGIATWQFQKMWPTALGDITLDWSTDAVEEYTVEFAYEYWTMGHSATSPMNTANTAKIAISTDTSSVIG